MAEVGDVILVTAAKGAPSKRGRVIDKAGQMLTVAWDDGHESEFTPPPGSISVEPRATRAVYPHGRRSGAADRQTGRKALRPGRRAGTVALKRMK